MSEQEQKSSEKMENQYNNLLEKYFQFDNQQFTKKSQKGLSENDQNIIFRIKKIMQERYQDFLCNWNNKEYLACLYSSDNQRKQFIPQFLCCTKGCLKKGVICGNRQCQCSKDHKQCRIFSIQTFIKNLQQKVRKPPNQIFYAYIQGKKVLLNSLLNRISKQRQVTQEWLNTFFDSNQQISQQATLSNQYYIYEYDYKIRNCRKIKIGNQKNLQCRECYELVQFKDKQQRQSKYGHLIKIISKTYNLIIDSFLKEIEKVQQAEKRSHYLNYAQYQILKHFMTSNGSIDCRISLEEITGNLVFIAKSHTLKEYIKKPQKINQVKKQKTSDYNSNQIKQQKIESKQQQAYLKMRFDEKILQDIKNKWNQKCQQIFDEQIKEVILQFDQLLKQKFDQPLFPSHKNLVDLVKSRLEQFFLELQMKQIYKGKKYQSLQISLDLIDKDILKPFSKIHLQTNLEKLQVDLSQEIGLKISQSILQKFKGNQLKHLSLYLYEINKFPNGFIQSLCKNFPQINEFYHSLLSNSQCLQIYQQDRRFINRSISHQLPIQQCLKLSKLKQLQNIFISSTNDKRSADIIKNMKKQLKHVSLHNNSYPFKRICKQLFLELLEIKSQLVTFSLAWLQINQDNVKDIMKIIQNNPNIQTLVLYKLYDSSNYIKSQFFQCIGRNLKNLKKLIIQNQYYNYNKIQSKDFQMLDQISSSLKLLNLSMFERIDKQSFMKTVRKMKNITHLILMGDNFVDDNIMQAIGSSLKKLEVLNLYFSNNITGTGLLKLQNLKYLNTLVFFRNINIKGKDMIYLSKQIKTLKKLELSQMMTEENRQNFIAQDLIAIDTNLNQGITHLKIYGCYKVDLNCIKRLKSLKLLWISIDHFQNQEKQELQIYVKQKDIILYQT